MITEKEIEQKANDALKSLEAKVDKLNDGSKQSKTIILAVGIILGTLIAYYKHH